MKGCPFCAMINEAVPVRVVLDEPAGFAFLDHRPVFKGHVLVVPRSHVAALADLCPATVGPFFDTVRRIAAAVESGLGVDGTFVGINNKISQSVPHLHAHVVPRVKGDGLRGFFWPRTRYADDEEADGYASRITAALQPANAGQANPGEINAGEI